MLTLRSPRARKRPAVSNNSSTPAAGNDSGKASVHSETGLTRSQSSSAVSGAASVRLLRHDDLEATAAEIKQALLVSQVEICERLERAMFSSFPPASSGQTMGHRKTTRDPRKSEATCGVSRSSRTGTQRPAQGAGEARAVPAAHPRTAQINMFDLSQGADRRGICGTQFRPNSANAAALFGGKAPAGMFKSLGKKHLGDQDNSGDSSSGDREPPLTPTGPPPSTGHKKRVHLEGAAPVGRSRSSRRILTVSRGPADVDDVDDDALAEGENGAFSMLRGHPWMRVRPGNRDPCREIHATNRLEDQEKRPLLATTRSPESDSEVEPIILACCATTRHGKKHHNTPLGKVRTFVNSKTFDICVFVTIVFNAMLIGLEAQDPQTASSTPVMWAERFTCVVFSLELAMRVVTHGMSFVTSPDACWNYLDTLLVMLQILDQAAYGQTDTGSSHFLRNMRLLRIIRLVRVLRFVDELRTIASSILGSMQALVWTLVLLFAMIYGVGVFFTEVSQAAIGARDDPLDDVGSLDAFFGTLDRTILTLFACITGGANWLDLAFALSEQVSPWMSVLVAFYVAFCIFAVMNVVTGVFVEQAMKSAALDKDLYLASHVLELFADKRDCITWEDFKASLDAPVIQEYFKAINIDQSEADKLFELLDIDGSGTISADEFVSGLFRLQGPGKSLDLCILAATFSQEMFRLRRAVGKLVCALGVQKDSDSEFGDDELEQGLLERQVTEDNIAFALAGSGSPRSRLSALVQT